MKILMILVLLIIAEPIHPEGSTDLAGLKELYRLEKIMLSSMGIK